MASSGTTVHEYRGVGYLYENWGADRVWVALEDVQGRVDEKRGELRSLISDRYHDLIDSADAIVGMDRTVEEFKSIVAHVEDTSRALVQGSMLESAGADQEARQRILLEARALLESEDLNLDTTCGAIRAVIVLGDATAAQSVGRLLDARKRVLLRTLQDKAPAALERSLTIMQQTIVDMADLYISGSRLVGQVDPELVQKSVTAWVQARGEEVARAAGKILARVHDIQALAQVQKRVIDIEVSGGASTDAASELDVDTWRAAARACIDATLWSDASKDLFLYPMMFGEAIIDRAADLLEVEFSSICATLERGTHRTLLASAENDLITDVRVASDQGPEGTYVRSGSKQSISGPESNEMGDGDGETVDDEDDLDEDERLYQKLGERIMSENAVDRAGAAVVLLHVFSSSVTELLERRAALVVDTTKIETKLNGLAKLTLAGLIDGLRKELADSVNVFGTTVSALGENNAQDSHNEAVFAALKRTLFLARIAEGLLVGDALAGLLDVDAQTRLAEELATLTSNVHQDWSNARDWAVLHSGWERIPVHFKDDDEEEEDGVGDDDFDLDDEDTIDLPGAVSPGVALFSFLLSKQIRLVGDSRFVSSGSVLAQSIDDLVGLLEMASPRREYLDAAAEKFCASSERAVLRLAHGALKLVQEAYETHVDRTASSENEPAALQTIFDLHWFEWLLLVDQDQEESNALPSLMERLVDIHVDTVNWTLQESQLLARIKVYRERNALLFGPSLMVKARAAKTWTATSEYAFESAGDPQDSPATSVYDTNNLLHLGYLPTQTLPRIPLLPIPSNIRSMHSRLASHRKRTSSRTLASPTAQGSGTSSSGSSPGSSTTASVEAAAALKSIGQVGSNLFSQASSWLNR
ncbi:Conserved oligomeric Golgi complex subunit 1 [Hondaea fermentalgiana]|uniref:Conserved oligomeric Golgi complex subunit 1 n=1 Tax=Hondaea fermentalgiana TaxID=2315210 RepID=A0A2R5GWM2_9STRA|nr:Conserved oligomeric Golgi complex subunit 1 [Hondaea fermentalgiana]|eukprot:GBG34729.1 Conserved oligomeric Golgi complex subunit 1 [Hondaea fermentalgiana]